MTDRKRPGKSDAAAEAATEGLPENSEGIDAVDTHFRGVREEIDRLVEERVLRVRPYRKKGKDRYRFGSYDEEATGLYPREVELRFRPDGSFAYAEMFLSGTELEGSILGSNGRRLTMGVHEGRLVFEEWEVPYERLDETLRDIKARTAGKGRHAHNELIETEYGPLYRGICGRDGGRALAEEEGRLTRLVFADLNSPEGQEVLSRIVSLTRQAIELDVRKTREFDGREARGEI